MTEFRTLKKESNHTNIKLLAGVIATVVQALWWSQAAQDQACAYFSNLIRVSRQLLMKTAAHVVILFFQAL